MILQNYSVFTWGPILFGSLLHLNPLNTGIWSPISQTHKLKLRNNKKNAFEK